jgi:molybdopterin/thiamine biosynthesis adenylyltransferase
MHESDIDTFFTENFPDGKKLDLDKLQSFPATRMYGKSEIWCGWEFEHVGEIFYVILGTDYPSSQPVVFLKDRTLLNYAHVEEDSKLCWLNDGEVYDPSYKGQYLKEAVNKTKYYLEQDELWHTQAFHDELLSYWNRHDLYVKSRSVLTLDNLVGTREVIMFNRTLFKNTSAIIANHSETINAFIKDFHGEELKLELNTALVVELSEAMCPSNFPINCKNVFKFLSTYAVTAEKAIKLLEKRLLEKSGVFPIIFNISNKERLHFVLWMEDALKPIRTKGFRKNIKPKLFLSFKRADTITPIRFSSVKYADLEWLYQRGSKGMDFKIAEKKVLIIGCGSLGSGVLKLLIKSGIRNIEIIDSDTYSMDNLMRHELPAEYIGMNKAEAMETYLHKSFPGVLKIKGHKSSLEKYYHNNPEFYQNFDLIIDMTASRTVMSLLSRLQVQNNTPSIIHGWLEAYAVSGHVIVSTGLGGCIECGYIDGGFNYALVQWNKSPLKHLEGCGVTYQSYGMTDIVPVQTMVAKTAIEAIEGKINVSEHRAWIGNISIVESMDGIIRDSVKEYYGFDGKSNYEVSHQWKANEDCLC